MLAVVLFHGFPGLVPGGFVGVDVFFVISGFLITDILIRQKEAGTLSLLQFYQRRILRILPALMVVLLSVLGMGWLLMFAFEYKVLGLHTAGGIGFVSNIVLMLESGYFDSASDTKPLLHLWSLAVEEQFYIFWPLLFVAVARSRILLRLTVFATLIGSFSYGFYLVLTDLSWAYYHPFGRFWEIMAGAGLALYCRVQDSCFKNSLISIIGISAILVACFVTDKSDAFPGFWAFLPVLGTVLVIGSERTNIVGRALSTRWLVRVGLISFPLYLWHWPLFVFVRQNTDGNPGWIIAMTVLAFVLSWLTWKMVELRVRFHPAKSKMAKNALRLAAVVGALAGVVFIQDGLPMRSPEAIRGLDLMEFNPGHDDSYASCWTTQVQAPQFPDQCFPDGIADKPSLIVWGDSFAAGMVPTLRKDPRILAGNANRHDCPPLLETGDERCRESNRYVIARINERKPDRILMFGLWTSTLSFSSGSAQRSLAKLQQTIDAIHPELRSRIILVGPSPTWAGNLKRIMLTEWRNNGTIPQRLPIEGNQHMMDLDAGMEAFARTNGLQFFSAANALCSKDGCLTYTGDRWENITSFDHGHLTDTAAQFLWEKIWSEHLGGELPLAH